MTLRGLQAEAAKRRLDLERARLDQSIGAVRNRCERSLAAFVREAWHVLEPKTVYIHTWHIDAISEHLEAVTFGQITRLLMNVPPGAMKSLLTSVLWPAWEWGPQGLGHYRYLTTAFAETAVSRDCRKMRTLIMSEWYQRHWPTEFVRTSELSFENALHGTRDGVPFASLTSKRGDRLIIDDPHSVDRAESDAERAKTVRLFREGAINRLNDQQRSAIVIIMQRLHQGDISGEIIESGGMGYCHLCLPMEFEEERRCQTEIGFIDPRSKDGELLAPARWSKEAVSDLKRDMTSYGYAGQYQQRPAPRGGGILPYTGWEYWSKELARKYGRGENQFPDMSFILGSLDTAYGEEQESDFSALVVIGAWTDAWGANLVMLMHYWTKRLAFNDLVEAVMKSCRKYKVDRLLVENKASGMSVYQELRRLLEPGEFGVQLINPGAEDKVARANSVSHLWGETLEDGTRREGLIYAPGLTQANGEIYPREWAEQLMAQCADFPKGKHDDGVDALTQGMRFLRARGMITKRSEARTLYETAMAEPAAATIAPLYPS